MLAIFPRHFALVEAEAETKCQHQFLKLTIWFRSMYYLLGIWFLLSLVVSFEVPDIVRTGFVFPVEWLV